MTHHHIHVQYNNIYNAMYISWWVYFVTGLNLVLQHHRLTVWRIEFKVAVLCAQQCIPWNLLIIKVLNIFWYFEHRILTIIYSEAHWNIIEEIVFEKSKKVQFLKTISSIMFWICFWPNPSQDLVFRISKNIQNFDYR